jgi:endoglucanase
MVISIFNYLNPKIQTYTMLKNLKILIVLTISVLIVFQSWMYYNTRYLFVQNNDQNSNNYKLLNRSTTLQNQYKIYLDNYFDKEFHRTIDPSQNGITTSEGQSYTMLRAVWMDDKKTFDQAWKWTQDNLQREDRLFSWKWGQKTDGSWGILQDIGGQNVATDADIDISLALLFASKRWSNNNYKNSAKEIINAIWENTVVKINGNYLLLPNNLEKNADKDYYLINPSYFSPAHYRIFANVDSNHQWEKLADDSYKFLESFQKQKISDDDQPTLPPDWLILDKNNLTIKKSDNPDLTTNYGFEALRISFRIGLDWKWFSENKAKDYLENLGALYEYFDKNNKLVGVYDRYGKQFVDFETKAMYGGSLPYFSIHHPDQAQKILLEKLFVDYDLTTQKWKKNPSYYDDNWSWFGAAFYLEQTPILF